MKHFFTIGLFFSLFILSCNDKNDPVIISYPDAAEVASATVLKDVKGVKVYNGGFGSALQVDPMMLQYSIC